jgi:hypothetical protein
MGASPNNQPHAMGLLPRVRSLDAQTVKEGDLMEEPVPSILPDINKICYGLTHFDLGPHQPGYIELWCKYRNTTVILAIEFHIPMPRERGKPRHGSAWYTFVARQKRQQRFEQHCLWPERNSYAGQEDSGHLPWHMWRRSFRKSQFRLLQNISSLLYLIIGSLQAASWGRPQWMPLGSSKTATAGKTQLEEFPTCYIEEEIPEALDSQEAAPAAEHFSVIDNEKC